MLFLLLGAPLVFTIGLLAGMGLCLMIVILVTCYASGIPLTSPMHIGVSIYLIIGKAWHRLTSSSPRLSTESIHNALLDTNKLRSLPYVRILPMTTPSKEAQFWDSLLVKEKENTFLAEIRKPYSPSRVAQLRRNVAFSEPMFTLYDKSMCRVTQSLIGDNYHEIALHWVQYSGASMANGVILCIHGGGYVAGMPSMQYSLCAELSKLTGAVCVSVDYRLCPDHGATITDALADCLEAYKYLVLEEQIPSSKICVIGESAGGGLALLLLQRIRDLDATSTRKEPGTGDSDSDEAMESHVYLGQPACCWVSSAWTDLKMDSASVVRNDEADGMLANDPKRYFQRMAIGEIDIHLNKRYKSDQDKPSLQSAHFSPLFGDWAELCPIYFMVGATEMLLDDTLRAAEKAHAAGTRVSVDIAPYMHHTWPLFLRTLPEAKYAVLRASDFILRQFKVAGAAAEQF